MADAPPVALRTYTAIRMGVVVVIASLGWAVYREIANAPGHCVQRSLSAYYYTPARPVFVGALIVIGFVMAAMWGMTFVEDAALNMAGLLLTVVALNPTLDATYCNVEKAVAGGAVPGDQTREVPDHDLINANAATISRGIFALLVVLTLLLVFVAIIAAVASQPADPAQQPSTRARTGYRATWLLAAATVLLYWLLFWSANNWPFPPWAAERDTVNEGSTFYHHVHGWSANLAVAFVFVAVVAAARGKLPAVAGPSEKWWKIWTWWMYWTYLKFWEWRIWTTTWSRLYGACAVAMAVTAVALKGGDAIGLYSGWLDEHATFLVEAILIFLIGVFWVIQTIDRRGEGAPTY